MTPDARNRVGSIIMRPFELETGTGMVESLKRLPLLLGDVTGLAGQICLPADSMRIRVTCGTHAGREAKLASGILEGSSISHQDERGLARRLDVFMVCA